MRIRHFTALLAIGITGCTADEVVTGLAVDGDAQRSLVQRPTRARGVDEEFRAMADSVSGFGGAYLDSEGRVVVVLADTTSSPLRERVLRLLPPALQRRSLVLKPGRYDYRRLSDWANTAISLLSTGDVYSVDADERINRVSVEVVSASAIGGVRARLEALGVPTDALDVRQGEPRVVRSSLLDRQAVRGGGLEIMVWDTVGNVGGCTFGYVASFAKDDYVSFADLWELGNVYYLTNSHCGGSRYVTGTNTGLRMYQAMQPDSIAYEYLDPPFVSTSLVYTCPPGHTCRSADVAAYKPYGPRNWWDADPGFGRAYRTVGPWTSTAGSTVLDDANGPFTIASSVGTDYTTPYVGLSLMKIGKSTGITTGSVTATCVHLSMLDEEKAPLNKTLFCQSEMSAGNLPGDSGSPVVEYVGSGYVRPVGMMWGGSTETGRIAFSDMAAIGADLRRLGDHIKVASVQR